MKTQQREQRKAQILALSEKVVLRRGVRRRNLRRAGVAGAALMLIVCGYYAAHLLMPVQREDSFVARTTPTLPVPSGNHAAAEPKIETLPSWVVLSAPLRDDQIIKSHAIAAADLATDSDLLQGLSEEDAPGIVRVKGRVFAAFELLPPPPAAPVPAGSGPIPPREDSAQTRVAAAL